VSLAELAHAYGVATEYWDWQGRHVVVGAPTIQAVLRALDVPCATPSQIEASLREVELRPWRHVLPPCTLARRGSTTGLPVHVPHGAPVTVWVEVEDRGGRREVRQVQHDVPPRDVDGLLTGEAMFEIPTDFPLGWHTLYAQVGDDVPVTAPLIVVPDALTLPPKVAARGAAGLMVQLYAARSAASWGIGDLADLGDLTAWAKRDLGADFVLVNPLHAAEPVAPMEPSPYLPTSRRFVNPIYLRVEEVPELAYLSARDRKAVEELARKARKLTTADVIDRDAAWGFKDAALRLVYAAAAPIRRQKAFEAFCEREGLGLRDFATWCAIAAERGITDWPTELEDVRSEAVAAERERLADEVRYQMWLQWIMDEQLASVQRLARAAGMTIGVMQDLAVGVHPEGADAWGLGEALGRGVTVGAPPDPYNQLGQNWSQPPWRPDKLADLGYAPYRDMLRAALRHSGALRIDHVIGLFRLWWIPAGGSPAAGTYVRYDHDAMIGVLMLEAVRAGAVLIGEDLGNVEPWVRDYLSDRGILGTSVLWFEREGDGFRPPEHYRRSLLATVNTHDLPPTAGYLADEHVALRARLGLLTRPVEEELADADAERAAMLAVLRDRGLLADAASEAQVIEALNVFITAAPSQLLGVALVDAVGERRAQNVPGTDTEYPNWQIPLADGEGRAVLLDDLATNPRFLSLTRAVDARF